MKGLQRVLLTLLCTNQLLAYANPITTTDPSVSANPTTPDVMGLPVKLSHDKNAYSIELEPLYLRPHTTSADESGLLSSNAGTVTQSNISPGYDWGFKLEAGKYSDKSLSLLLNWAHFQSTYQLSSGAFTATTGQTVLSSSSQLHPEWDAANIEVGRSINFDKYATLRFHSGFQFARIYIKDMTQQVVSSETGPIANTQTIDHLFNGFGARLGISTSQHFGHGFHIFLNSASALLVGTHSQNINSNVASNPSSHFSKSALVPVVEINTGAMYDHPILNGPLRGTLSVKAAWIWFDYIDTTLHTTYSSTTGQYSSSESSFGLQGPMFSLKWTSFA